MPWHELKKKDRHAWRKRCCPLGAYFWVSPQTPSLEEATQVNAMISLLTALFLTVVAVR